MINFFLYGFNYSNIIQITLIIINLNTILSFLINRKWVVIVV